MSLKLGDRVLVLDEDLSGVVTKVEGHIISLETEDGFILEFNDSELVVQNQLHNLKKEVLSQSETGAFLSGKENPKRKNNTKKRAKDRYEPTLEVDLHIHQLVKSSRGMNNHDMLNLQLDTARRQLEFAIKNRIQKMVFIHGVGEGVLKLELEYLFGRYNNIKYYDANYQKYGLGATEVYVYQNASRK